MKKELTIKLTAEQKKGRKNIKLPEITFLTPGGLRRNIYAGNITVGDIYELMPFENKIALIPANYQEINCLVDFILKSKPKLVHFSGMYIQEQPLKILINGKALKKDKKYLIGTIDYLALGGDNMTCFLNNSEITIQQNFLFRDLLLDYIEGNKILNIQAEKRIQFKQ